MIYKAIRYLNLCLLLGFLMLPSLLAAEPIEISSHTLKVKHLKNQAEFKGSVHLVRGDFDLRCDRLLAYYEDNVLQRAEAFGRVRMHQQQKKGVADKAVYRQQSETLTLSGRASVEDKDTVVRGETIVYHLKSKQSKVLNSKKETRVHMRIETADDKSGTAKP